MLRLADSGLKLLQVTHSANGVHCTLFKSCGTQC